jgi:hypothetical protein
MLKCYKKEDATMKKAKIAIIGLGHYIYFNQFEGLREELMQKSEQFKSYLDPELCDVVDLGYADCVDTSFEAVKNIREGIADRSNIWNVNTEKSYHEKK